MEKIVLTGGPCSGKTTVLNALKSRFEDQIVFVPEVATVLLEGGFPIPGQDLEWSEGWQASFQSAVLPLQESFENTYTLIAQHRNSKLIVCDRGVLDGAAYTPGGVVKFCKQYGVDKEKALARYKAVISLESLASIDPGKYGKQGNKSRFEPLERALELDKATRCVWGSHRNQILFDGARGIEKIISEVVKTIHLLLNRKGV